MARREARPRAERERVLRPARRCCPGCGRRMPIRYENRRTVATLDGPVRLRLKVRRCEDAGCVRHHRPTGRKPRAPSRCRGTSSAST